MIMLNNNLRIFITAAELESLTEAAKKLYVSQPAISQAIRKLEEELGVKLFIRNKRSTLSLTDAGKDILSLAYKMADLENRLYQRAYEENHLMGGMIRIASVPLGVSLILSHVLPIFKKQFPDVQVELLEGTPIEVKNMVLNFQADIGITTSPYLGLSHKLLMMDHMVSISRDKAVRIDLRNENKDLILCRVAKDSCQEQLAGQNVDLSHAQVVEAASTQINMIEMGNGRGVISELMLSTIPNELVRGAVLPKMEIEISLIAHDFDELPAAAKEISDMILQRAL
ncbi:MAG: LysR family transcriptional regulator [Lachnospiraceae bacterium]|nr:LysR family transcriptional regulator [Lachnospiraceae bacterium]